jgi:hypothetical protein
MKIKNKFVIKDHLPEDSAIIAPRDFIALLTGYIETFEIKSKSTELSRDLAASLVYAWLDKPENTKRICIIKSIK